MARKKDKRRELEAQAYIVLRDLWDRASRAQIELENADEEVTPEAIWRKMGGEGDPPRTLVETLSDEQYNALVSIRRSLAVLPDVKNLALIRELAGRGAQLAAASALEDLVLHPEKVSTKDKVNFIKILSELYTKLEGAVAPEDKITDAALSEEKAMEEALAKIPEPLRPRMRELWLKERALQLRKERALTLVAINGEYSYAKDA